MSSISEDFDVMADAGRVHGQVLEQWPKMFQILGLFISQRQQTEASQEEEFTVSSNFEGQRLVRVPIDELASEKH
ncbi:hypothetical protein BDN71DRAFT_1445050 [Pleurotus eryngii]|uniref:Uncharacterized protein n=1 Tax=Pleurotus eryngii TaxID=5323 RepID=A0A9P6A3U7_PLEER|nr:hypothetical protein BDN71DRAFT_1450154 [Pleurotus eryngii]KAF9497309.1 hypothetical protein BDN71DRAFT_1445050 [Pleurotus eryngii]